MELDTTSLLYDIEGLPFLGVERNDFYCMAVSSMLSGKFYPYSVNEIQFQILLKPNISI